MAIFQGSVQEFHHFFGPKIRNAINNLTRKYRNEKNGVCEFCGKTAELQSAHVHGRNRRMIIEMVLKHHTDSEGNIVCSLGDVEAEIIKAHEPIEETFKFICHPCHVEYDSTEKSKAQSITTYQRGKIKPEFSKLSRIKLWANRPHQINSKIIRAYLKLENDGEVSLSKLRKYCIDKYAVSEFDSHFASMKTDKGNSHGAVFYENGQSVKIWDRVRDEINIYFNKPT